MFNVWIVWTLAFEGFVYDELKLYFFANGHIVSLFVTALIITILVTTMSNQIDF